MEFSFNELVDITNAHILKHNSHFKILEKIKNDNIKFKISTDTRTISKDNIFLPIVGKSYDGHDFIKNAIESGVILYFTSRSIDELNLLTENAIGLYVENTKEAYLKLASYYKEKIDPITIAVTGSSGKTTTKEMIYSVVSQVFRCHKSEKNHNNEIGLCQTLLSMPQSTQVLIVEMGMRNLGEIDLLSRYTKPDIAIITNVGTAHIGILKTQENIAKAKSEICNYLKEKGILIAEDSELIKRTINYKGDKIFYSLKSKELKIIKEDQYGCEFEYKSYIYKLKVSGSYNIKNAICAIEVGLNLHIIEDKIQKGLESYKPLSGRWEIERVNNLNIINDSYNANPDSMKESINDFLTNYPGKKYLVLADMGELGLDSVKYHEEIGEFLNNYKYEKLLTIGNLSKYISSKAKADSEHFYDNESCKKYIFDKIKEGYILIKGSRSNKLEELLYNVNDKKKA